MFNTFMNDVHRKVNKMSLGAVTEAGGERREQLREALIQAAERTIAEHGHHALRARALAQEVGCAVGAIYNVFPDLDALLLAVKGRTLDAIDEIMTTAAAAVTGEAGTPEADLATGRLVALAQAYLRFAAEQPKRWQLLFEHRLPDETQIPEWFTARLARMFVHVDEPLDVLLPKQMSATDRTLFGRALFSAVHGIVALGLENKFVQVPPALIAAQAAAIVRSALAGVAQNPKLGQIAERPPGA